MYTWGGKVAGKCLACGIAVHHRQTKTTFWRGRQIPGKFWWFSLDGILFEYLDGKPWICSRCVSSRLTGLAAPAWSSHIKIEDQDP